MKERIELEKFDRMLKVSDATILYIPENSMIIRHIQSRGDESAKGVPAISTTALY